MKPSKETTSSKVNMRKPSKSFSLRIRVLAKQLILIVIWNMSRTKAMQRILKVNRFKSKMSKKIKIK